MAKKKRPPILKGDTIEMETGCGKLFITINSLEGKPMEVMGRMGKSGGCISSNIEAIGRLATLALRHDVPAEEVMKEIQAIRCPEPKDNGKGRVLSCADAFAKAMQYYLKMEEEKPELKCPKCGGKLKKEGEPCEDCGFEKGNLK